VIKSEVYNGVAPELFTSTSQRRKEMGIPEKTTYA